MEIHQEVEDDHQDLQDSQDCQDSQNYRKDPEEDQLDHQEEDLRDLHNRQEATLGGEKMKSIDSVKRCPDWNCRNTHCFCRQPRYDKLGRIGSYELRFLCRHGLKVP